MTEVYLMQLYNKSEEFVTFHTSNTNVKKKIIFVLEHPKDEINGKGLVESEIEAYDPKIIKTDISSPENIKQQSTYYRIANKNVRKSIVIKPITVEFFDEEADPIADNSQFHNYDLKNMKQLSHEILPSKKYSEVLKCLLCNIEFQSRGKYFQHMMNEHPELDDPRDNLKPLTCKICQKQFRYRKALFKHLDEHDPSRKYVCVICKIKCTSKNMFSRHLKSSKHKLKVKSPKKQLPVKEFNCSVCHQQFDDSVLFKVHMINHGSSVKHKCQLCDVEFNTWVLYERHIKTLGHRNKLDPRKVLSRSSRKLRNKHCSICQKQFTSYAEVQKHMIIHRSNEKHKCVPCNLDFDTRQEYILHANSLTHFKVLDTDQKLLLRCDLCEYTTYNKGYYKEHVNMHLGVTYPCHICGKELQNSFTLRGHIGKHYGKRKKSGENSKRVCDLCGKVLCGPTVWKKHMRLHTGERPYKCDECDMCFLSAGHRSVHKRKIHMEKSVACPLCSKMFYLRSSMRTHVKKVHWKSTEEFDYTKLKGLTEEEYDLFKDGRNIIS